MIHSPIFQSSSTLLPSPEAASVVYFNFCHQLIINSRREVHLDIWQSTPVNSSPSSPTVILLGYAGSPKHHLTKFEDLYNNLGYRSISSIMPHKHIFEYDVASIRDCASQVLDKIQGGCS